MLFPTCMSFFFLFNINKDILKNGSNQSFAVAYFSSMEGTNGSQKGTSNCFVTNICDVTFDTEASKLVSKKRNISHWSAVSELDSFCQKHVICDVWSFIRLKTTWLLHIWFKRSEPQRRFLYTILHYNALALFYFYLNLYIKVKWTLPMK